MSQGFMVLCLPVLGLYLYDIRPRFLVLGLGMKFRSFYWHKQFAIWVVSPAPPPLHFQTISRLQHPWVLCPELRLLAVFSSACGPVVVLHCFYERRYSPLLIHGHRWLWLSFPPCWGRSKPLSSHTPLVLLSPSLFKNINFNTFQQRLSNTASCDLLLLYVPMFSNHSLAYLLRELFCKDFITS